MEDAPLNLTAAQTGSKEWSPQNYENTFEGPINLRQALAHSVNLVAIRVLQSIGVSYAQDYITRFGFAAKDHPPYLTMALGAGSTTPWKMATAYAVFANGGYLIEPNIIAKIVDKDGKVLSETKTVHAGIDAPRVIDSRNAFIMNSMLQEVVRHGTATQALQLGRADLAGKTGTTNDHIDAWFNGYTPKQVAVAWVGFDKPETLGRSETGAAAALPIWIKYMATALRGVPEVEMPVPDGVTAIKINRTTGMRADSDESAVYEYFYQEMPPPGAVATQASNAPSVADTLLGQAQHILQPEARPPVKP